MRGDAGREFVDTNVLIYAHDLSAEEKQRRAAALVAELWETGRGCLSLQVLQEFYVAVTQKVAKPLPPAEAARLVADLSAWRVHVPEVSDLLAAIEIQQRNRISFWDAMVIRSAQALDCAVIWSEDLNPGQAYDGVRVVNPFGPAG
ncbi:MAG: PIN domain-containing protein [Thermoanaerobacteraceae bacterium]|nr:PIN domain-containing protein [Thermoanaerobacteraceae bacterium]